jgi:hypothetical protein
MKIFGRCKNCKNEVPFSTRSTTRFDLAMKSGESKTLYCKKCGIKGDFHVDDLYTKESKIAQIGAGLILLIGTPLIFFSINGIFIESRNHYMIYILGGFLLVPVIVYSIINKQDQTRVSSFNRNKLKGRIPKPR